MQNLRYPIEAQRNGISGKIFVEFIVLKNGEIAKIETPKNSEKTLVEEAKRIVKQMPKWKPATIKGESVNSQLVLPISSRNMGVINR